ncbi:PAS domain S-box protein [Nostoc sp. HG1]|nr:PAS domain S-box protein [Nostoc sp. HG1]
MFICTTALTPLELKSAIARDPLIVSPDTRVMDTIALMSGVRSLCAANKTADSQLDELHREVRSSCVLVVENERLLGILTERDVVRLIAQQQPLDRLVMQQVMAHPVVTLRESDFTDLFFAINLLLQHHIRHLPMLDEHDRLVGLVTHESLRQISRPSELLRLRLVAEVMTSEVIFATPDCHLRAITQQMANHRISSVMIVEQGSSSTERLQIPLGIVTERDMVQFQALGLNLDNCTAEAVMSTPIFAVKPEDSLWNVQQIMAQRLIRRLAVTGEQGELLGIVTQTSLLQALNPLELYKLVEVLDSQVVRLEAEKVALLENRNVELEQQVQARTVALETKAKQERLLNTIADHIRSSLNLQEILDTTVREICSLLGCDRVIIYQFRPDFSGTVIAEAITGTGRSMLNTEAHDPCSAEWLEPYRNGKIRILDDIYNEAITLYPHELLVGFDIRAQLMVPIVIEEQLWGLMLASYRAVPHTWTTDEIELIRQVSLQVAIALQQATTHQRLQNELTKRRKVEVLLLESEQRYATLVTAAPVGIFRTDTAGKLTYINDRYCQISGLTASATIGKGWQQGLHPDDRDWVTAEWEQLVQENHPFQLEYRFQHPDGTVLWVYGQSVAEGDADGQVVGYVGTVTDISDRKRTETQLQESEGRYATLVEASPVGIFRTDAVGNCIYVNDRWCEISGLTPTTTFGDGWREGLHPDDRVAIATEWQQSIEENRPFQLEYRFQRPDGKVTWVYGQSVSELDSDGQVVGYVGTVTDISDRKQAEQQLQQLNQELEAKIAERTQELWQVNNLQRAILDGADYSIISTDPTGIIETFNAAAEGMLGYSAAEMVGKATPELIHDRQEVINRATSLSQELKQNITPGFEVFVAKARQGIVTEEEWTYISSYGSRFPVLLSITALKDANQQIIGFVGIAKDITNRKRAEQKRQQLVQELSAFKSALDQSAIVAITDAKGVITYVNDRFCEISGYSRDAALGQTHRIVNSGYHPPSFFQDMWRTIASGGVWRGEVCNRTKNGSLYWLASTIVPFLDEQRRPFQYLAIRFDITDRKLAEATLQQENTFRQQIVENMAEGLCVFHEVEEFPFVHFTVWNRQMQTITGYTLEDINSLGWYQSVYPDTLTQEQAITRLGQLWQGENQIAQEREIQRQDGQKRTVAISTSVLSSNDGLTYILALIQDITDRKQTELRLQQQAKQERLLGSITQRVRSSLNLDEVLNTTVEEIRQVLQSDRALVYRVFPGGTGAAIAESVLPKWPKILDILFPQEVFPEENYERYIQGRVYALSDREDENQPVLPCLIQFLSEIHVRAKLVVPIVQNHTLWGLLIVHQCDLPRQWEDWEINLLKQTANQLAIAIQQANLYEQVQSELVIRKQTEEAIALQLERQRTLGVIVQQIRDSLDINQILATVTQQVKEILRGDRVIVFRLFGNGRSQIVKESVSSQFPALKERQWDNEVWSQEILECYWQGKPRIVPDVMTDIWTNCLVEYCIEGQIQSKIVAPILQEVRVGETHRWVAPGETNKLWGVLVIHSCREKRVWQESEAQLLQQIANQLAIALQQASLFEQLQQELTERQQAQQQVTERNQQLAVSNEELARATRLKDEFLANMSHELRTPLNAILGMTEGLQEAVFGIVNEAQIKALQTIERSGSHLLELINDILDVAKIESGQMELDYTPVSINRLCQSSLAFIKQQAMQKRLQLEIKIPLNLPDFLIDERRIRQVLINLLNNAVKFTPEGGRITLEVTRHKRATVLVPHDLQGNTKVMLYQTPFEQELALKPQEEGLELKDYLRIAVIDTGIGIAPENINKLFQPFIQIDSALNRQYAGTGLGLALVKRIVELHGGQVGLTSQVGLGSCFTIDLPGVACELSSPNLSSPNLSASNLKSQAESPIEFFQPEKEASPLILLAEDNEANISTVTSYLKAKGYRIVLAKNGEEAIAQAKSKNPNIILMDIQMPGMDGLEAMEHIRRDPNLVNVPIIALTALAMTGDRDRCLAAGANDYLTKPVKLKQLVSSIQQLLGP